MPTIIELIRETQLMKRMELDLRSHLRNRNYNVTVIILSEVVNKQSVLSLFKSLDRDIQVLFNVPDKPTVETVKELCELPDSEFWNYYKGKNIEEKYQILYYWLKRMKMDFNGFYCHNNIGDKDVKHAIKKTLEELYYNVEEMEEADSLINGKNVLLFSKEDDEIDYIVKRLETKYKPLSIKQIRNRTT